MLINKSLIGAGIACATFACVMVPMAYSINNFHKIEAIYTPPSITQDYTEMPAAQRVLLHIRDAQYMTAKKALPQAEAHLYRALTSAVALSGADRKALSIHRIGIFSVKDEDGGLFPVLYVDKNALTKPMDIQNALPEQIGEITHAEIRYLSNDWERGKLLSALSLLHRQAQEGTLKPGHFKAVFEPLYQAEINRIPSRQKAQDQLTLARMLMNHQALPPAEAALAEARKYIEAMTQAPATLMISKDSLRKMVGEIETFEANTLSEGDQVDMRLAQWVQQLS